MHLLSDADACGLYIAPSARGGGGGGGGGDDGGRFRAAPLIGTSITGHIVDLCTRQRIEQVYANDEPHSVDCVYTFPLNSRASVCGFEIEIAGRVHTAHVKEKAEARAEYLSALARGGSAQLVEKEAGDVFTIRMGNLRPGEVAVLRLDTVAVLRVVGGAVEFFAPTFVAPRYDNTCLPALEGLAPGLRLHRGLSISMTCRMASRITSIASVAHTGGGGGGGGLAFNLDAADPAAGAFTLAAPAHRDVVVHVRTVDANAPRVHLEVDPATGAVSAAVSIVPRLDFVDAPCEFVFLVDRSGSMGGAGIHHAAAALKLFLRSLPKDCYFNIVGFGSRCELLFPEGSVANGPRSLATATAHASALRADLGGTEILAPMVRVLSQPAVSGYARQVFLLTDGQVRNTDEIARVVAAHAHAARCFGLGLGHGASRDLVERVAQAGRGTADFVMGSGNDVERAVIEQLDRAMQPCLAGTTLTWETSDVAGAGRPPPPYEEATAAPAQGIGEDVGSLLGYTSPGARAGARQHGARAQAPQQAPHTVPPVFSGERLAVFTIFPGGTDARDVTAVTLRCNTTPDGPLSVRLPVGPARPGNTIHTLAAQALIQDLEHGTSWLHASPAAGGGPSPLRVKAEMVRLGCEHGLASKHTSYIATQAGEHWGVHQHGRSQHLDDISATMAQLALSVQSQVQDQDSNLNLCNLESQSCSLGTISMGSSALFRKKSSMFAYHDSSSKGGGPGIWLLAAPVVVVLSPLLALGYGATKLYGSARNYFQRSAAANTAAANAKEARGCSATTATGEAGEAAGATEASGVPDISLPDVDVCGPPPPIRFGFSPLVLADAEQHNAARTAARASAAAGGGGDPLQRLAESQAFDGSFALGTAFAAAVGLRLCDLQAKAAALHASCPVTDLATLESCLAVAVALAYLRAVLPLRHAEWRLMARKSEKWLAGSVACHAQAGAGGTHGTRAVTHTQVCAAATALFA